jgi:hypothetical protein
MDVVTKITAAKYRATEADIEALTAASVESSRIGPTYMRALMAETLHATGAKRRPAQLKIFEATHERFYAAVLRGIDSAIKGAPPPEAEAAVRRAHALERNRQGTFARSAASTVRSYLRAGGDLRDVDIAAVTKAELRAKFAPKGTRSERIAAQWQRAHDTLLRIAKAEENPTQARERVEGLLEELQGVLDALDEKPAAEPAHERPVQRARAARGRRRSQPAAQPVH